MTEPPVGKSADKVAQSRQAPESPGIQAFGAIALAFLLYALLADAAIETFASGWSVRWWVAGIIVVYTAASVVLWRRPRLWDRLGWRNRAAASFFLLLGLLAFTAWLPGGQVAGVKLAAQPTSTVFTAVTAVAVLLSAFVLLRALKSTPLWARAAVGALAVYGLGAFVIGIARHTPYSELLSGASLWVRAPFWLQGAFLGVFVVVPVAVVAEMIALGRRMAARSAWSGEMGRVVALALSALMAAPALTLPRSAHGVALAGTAARFAFADERELRQAAAERLVDEPPPMPSAVDSARLLEKAGAVVRSFRPGEWEIAPLAASLGNDPAAAFAFVRDAIAFDPYAGVLRGAEGTLAARAGNAWDRALLLRALLANSGLKTRLAFATLDSNTAMQLVKRAYQRPTRRLSEAAPAGLLAGVVTPVAARARRDDAALRLALGSRVSELGVDDGEMVRQGAARHAWVQVQKGDAWVDLDPTFPDGQMGKALAVASGTAEEVPPEQQQTVVVRVVAETLADGKLSETVSLERELPAVTAAGQYLLLAFLPEEGKEGGRLIGGTTSPSSFVPTLLVGDKAQTGRTIATGAAGGGAGFGSLFGGEEASADELVGLFIEVETRVPDRRPNVARHVLLDRVPPDARSASVIRADALKPMAPDGSVPRAFRGFHHLLISTGGASPLDMARLRLAAMEDAPVSGASASKQGRPNGPVSLLWACDLTLVEGSERLVVQAVDSTERGRVYVDEPRIFLGSWFPPAGDEGLSRETDLLIDSVRLLPPERTSVGEVAQRQLQYGALQSALETEIGLRFAAASDPDGRTIVSTSLATGGRLTVLAPPDVQQLPARSASSLRQALLAGNLAVVPGDVAAAQVWWTVARSGFVRAIIQPRAGGFWTVTRKPAGSGPGNNSGGSSGKYASMVKTKADEAKQVGQAIGRGVRAAWADESVLEAGAETATNLARYRTLLGSSWGF